MTTDDWSLPADTHLGRTALRVADLEEVTEFYRRVVGLEVLADGDGAATLGAGGTPVLELVAAPEVPEPPRPAAGLYHSAFRVPSRAALGGALERIRERSRLDGASDHGVSEALYLSDPEGNGVEVYRDRPRAEWPRGDDDRLSIPTDPLDLEGVVAAADGATDAEGAPPGTVLGHVHLEVTSLDAFEAFYVDALGFETQATVSGARFVGAGGYHHHVGANVWNGRSAPASGRGLAWFEVVLPDAGATGAVRERLATRDAVVHEVDDGDAAFEVTDPDGVGIRFRTAD